jgi:hypothetical protein
MAEMKSTGDSETPSDGSGVRIIHTVSETVAATSRSSLDLLALPFPFSQVSLLTAEEFLKAATWRRIQNSGHGEIIHAIGTGRRPRCSR